MSEWSELCSSMNINDDEDALEKMIDQFIADDKEYGLIKDNSSQPIKELTIKYKKIDGQVSNDLDPDGDIPF